MKRATQWTLRVVAAVGLAVPMWWMTLGIFIAMPYGVAIRTSKWITKTMPPKVTLERHLWYCTSRPIEMKKSLLGCYYELQDGEYCIQHRVFGLPMCPIDVVYGPDGDTRIVFESYE